MKKFFECSGFGSPRKFQSACRHLRCYRNEGNSQALPGKVMIEPGDSGSYSPSSQSTWTEVSLYPFCDCTIVYLLLQTSTMQHMVAAE